MSFLKPKAATQSSLSENVNNDMIKNAYGGSMDAGAGATNALQQLLGVGRADQVGGGLNQIAQAGGAQAGYQNYLQNAGYAPALQAMQQNITGQGAASGLLNSGATSKALLREGANLNQGYFNNYLQQLSGLAGQGLQAGGLVANTGQRSTSNSTAGGPSTLGTIASTVGGLASIFSDPRLKTDVRKLGTRPDGLGVYSYRYLGSLRRVIGVMANEVAKLRPDALGPTVQGFATVNYGAL
jgi:hypothetical protein